MNLCQLWTIFITFVITLTHLLPAAAQQAAQPAPPPSWPGPWWQISGEGYGWSFWWICPLMMLLMMLFCGGMFFKHMWSRDRSDH